jgi:hypothetical protein
MGEALCKPQSYLYDFLYVYYDLYDFPYVS